MKKRILSLVLAVLLVFSCLSSVAMAESEEYYDVPDLYGMYNAAAITNMVCDGFAKGENASFSFIINYLIYYDAFGETNIEVTYEDYTYGAWQFTYDDFIAIVDANFANFSEDEVKAGLMEMNAYDTEKNTVTIEPFGGFGGGFYYYAEDDIDLGNGEWEVSGMVLDYEVNYYPDCDETIASLRPGYDYVIGYDEEGKERYEIVGARTKVNIITEDGVAKINGFTDVDYHVYNGVLYPMTETDNGPMRKVFMYLDEGSDVSILTTAVAVPLYNETAEIWFPMSEITFTVDIADGFLLNSTEVYCGWDLLEIQPDEDGIYTVPAGDDSIFIDVYTDREIIDTKEKFDDVEEKWYKDYVDYAVTYELFNGVSDTEFAPNQSMTRGMFVTVLSRLSGENLEGADFESVFDDVADGRYYSDAIAWAATNDIVNGLSETEFGVNENITREQMCTMLVRFADYMWIELSTDVEKAEFADNADISKWAKDAVYACQQAGIVNGVTATTFEPKGTATRGQVAKILSIFHQDYLNW